MKVKMTYYVLYMTENGIGNRVVQVDGGIQAAGQLQAICNQIMNQDKVRAVRHSMVVIDAEKHHLDYKQSEIDNNIPALKKEYQAHYDSTGHLRFGGASTLISRAKGEIDVDKRQGQPHPNLKGKPDYDQSRPEGSLLYKRADDADYTTTKVDKRTGEIIEEHKVRTQKSTKMAETDNAMTLVSEYRHPMELIYADYANTMKSLANQARVEISKTGKIAYSKEAKANHHW